ncbi:hypothetical protein SELMODRAFT_414626 [Selaginella moellendorffii]|uniref:Peptidase S8/S53 domain-containing protein n=1 Tax=Selaginella moellendorffii TaxID=88036 RepID=D8RTE4_SELML|nr:hypothetical protein SELMODRAFT_414626 [Selaginella moellendorffii]
MVVDSCWKPGSTHEQETRRSSKSLDRHVRSLLDGYARRLTLLRVSTMPSTTAIYSVDVIAIDAYHAVERGIMVSCAGGNSGPFTGSVSNGALWIFTVGATTIDREINEDAKIAANRKSRILRGTTIPYKPAPVVRKFS